MASAAWLQHRGAASYLSSRPPRRCCWSQSVGRVSTISGECQSAPTVRPPWQLVDDWYLPQLNEFLNLTRLETSHVNFDVIILLNILFVIIIMGGVAGNIINLIIFWQKKMQKSIIYRFVFHLSFVDLVTLVICGTETFLSMVFEIDLRVYSIVLCKCNTFLAHYLLQMRFDLTLSLQILTQTGNDY